MIVKHHEEGWEIISHYAHGLLSGKIAQELRKKLRPQHWLDVLTGIVEHDDHLLDFDEQDYLTENGTPKDFMMDGGTDAEALEHAKRVYSNALQKSQLVALMVGRHLAFLYDGLADDFKPMEEFLNEIGSVRGTQRKLYGLKKSEEDSLYNIMLFCDRLSLILCQEETPEVGRKLEINRTIEDEQYFISKDSSEHLTVEPWPFEKEEFTLAFEYRILNRPTFKDCEELESCLNDAEICIKSYTFKK
ncbi:DUF3891 family protein [Ulvibacterium marinum]|uniref:DUF3891 family protein n=1 Tax=Ulvibacterium marinum TaxID=2419782 RepID=A0A3B0CDS9_9FLAO|nr:DUF3891 family protein [Ulvibacterium marinum]RKN83490.1 DUF3891 family protein [Ulvibacterium marinum]